MQRGRLFYLFFGLSVLVLQSSCNTTKFLKGDEYLLKKNEIILNSEEKIENKPTLKYELSTLYRQKVNGKFFFVPREWFYYKTDPPEERKRFGKWIHNTIGQAPVLFKEAEAAQTADVMRRYLNDKGYYAAEVYYEDEISKKGKAQVKYYINPNNQLKVDTASFSSEDPAIDSILQLISDRTLFTKGKGLERQLIEEEKDRITDYLRNHGYANFSASFFPRFIDADTTVGPNRAHVYLKVNRPYEDTLHRIYTVGEISVFPEYDISIPETNLKDTTIQGIHFRVPDYDFLVKPQVIINAIYLKEGNTYRQIDYDLTNRTLGNLSIYRFVRIKEELDSVKAFTKNFRIELTPAILNEIGFDLELDYTNRSNTSGAGNLIGASISPSLQNRNYLRGAELFIGNLSAGVEINPEDSRRFWNTIDLGVQADLYLPRFRDYFGFWKTFDRLSFRRNVDEDYSSFFQGLLTQSATRIRTSYNYVLLLDFYRYNLLTASYGYDFQRDQNHRYILNNLAIDYFDPTTQEAFNDLLDANTFLERSFGDQLFVSLLFREFNYVYNGPTKRLGERRYFSFNVETAGFEVWSANSIYNAFSSKADTFRIGDTDFSQYVRLETDLRLLRSYNSSNAFAARLSVGVARPFGFSTDVPYVKQFYVGGPNSIRAWPARSLGPGGFIDSLTLSINNPLLFYQTGDVKLEFNLEYRFNIFWRLNGALFLDGGNIWTFREDKTRPESQFLLRPKTIIGQDGTRIVADPFFKQIALGTGFGLRFDFTYFIFRLDMGLRLKYPYKWRDDRYWVSPTEWFEQVNFNFSLGYPF